MTVEHTLNIYEPRSPLVVDEENILEYRPGGFHPARLGDVLKNGRYTLLRKLGRGGYATVWAARDSERNENVSIKILQADQSWPSLELRMLSRIHEDRGMAHHVVQLLDSFVHDGPNGSHECLVLEFLGPSVRIIDELFEDEICHISYQVLDAIASLHRQKIVHGDISPQNVAYYSPKLKHLTVDRLDEVLGPFQEIELRRKDGRDRSDHVPPTVIQSATWDGWPLEEDMDDLAIDINDVRLIDLGESFLFSEPPSHLAQPADLIAPETHFGGQIDHGIDLWRAGLLIYFLVVSSSPISGYYDKSKLSEVLIRFAGPIPPEWSVREQVHEPQSQIQSAMDDQSLCRQLLPIEYARQKFDEISVGQNLLDVITKLTTMRPSDRINARSALELIPQISI